MKSNFKKKLIKFVVWLVIFNLSIAGTLLSSLKQVKAHENNNQVVSEEVSPSIEFAQYYVKENETVADVAIKVNLSKASEKIVTVKYAVTNASAIENTDYTLVGDTLEIPAGELSAEINLTIINDLKCQADKTIDISLSDPENADLGSQTVFTYRILETDCNVTTAFAIDSTSPTPTITLTAAEQVDTFYQWDDKDIDSWNLYTDPLIASEGQHILYYFSMKYDQAEEIQGKIINVDLTIPQTPVLQSNVDANGVVTLSWQAVTTANTYEVWRTDNLGNKVTLTKDQLSIIDNTVSRGYSYQYNIQAIDAAGNHSATAKITVIIPAAVIVTPASHTQTEETWPVVSKNISNGVSDQQKEEEIAGTNDTAIVETPSNEDTQSHRNWNQLLLAISILIIAIGVAIGGYYGYEWWMSHRDDGNGNGNGKSPKQKSRW